MMPNPGRILLSWAAILVSLAFFFGPAIAESLAHAVHPLHLNDDARQQVWPFLRYHEPGALQDDLIADYYLDYFPLGSQALYAAPAPWIDPRILSKALPYLLFSALAVCVAWAGHRLGGFGAAWGSLAILLSAGLVFDRMIGGLPRAFGFPIAGLTLLGMVLGSPLTVAAAAVLAAAFYPPPGVVAGLSLAGLMLVLPGGGGARWRSPARRLALLASTAAAMVVLLLPVALRTTPYGEMLAPEDVGEYPELGPGGRYAAADRHDYPFLPALRDILPRSVGGEEDGWLPRAREALAGVVFAVVGILTVGLWGVGLADRERGSAFLRASLLLAASVVAFFASKAVAPFLYLPQRHLVYTLPVLVAVVVPAGGVALAVRIARERWRWLGGVVTAALLVAFFGTRGPGGTGYTLRLPRLALYDSLRELPPDSRIAGWPGGLTDIVPYVSARPVLVSFETHQAFHRGYADSMRRRMRALIDLNFARDPGPAARLRAELGVTHLLLDSRWLGRPPRYFAPFDSWIAERAAGWEGPPPDYVEQLRQAVIASDGPFAIVDLELLLGREEE